VRLQLFTVIMLISIVLMLFGVYLTLIGVEISYDVVRVPEYHFEIVEPGNITEVYEVTVFGKTIGDTIAAPGEVLKYSFALEPGQKEQERFLLSIGYMLCIKTGLFTPSGHVLKRPPFKIHLYQVYNNGSVRFLANLTSHFELSHKVVDIGEALKLDIVKNETAVHGYRYVVAGGFSHDLTGHVPATFELEIVFTEAAYIRHLRVAVRRVYKESVYVPFQVVRDAYRDPTAHVYRVVSEISLEKFQLGVVLMCIGLAIPILYIAATLALRISVSK